VKRVVFVICAGIAIAATVFLLLSSANPNKTAPLAAINAIDAQLLKEGFQLDQRLIMKDEIVLGPANPAKTWLLSRIYPGYQTRSENRTYLRAGAKLGIDFGLRGNSVLNVSVSADPAETAQARKIQRELSDINPNLTIWLRTNTTTAATR
jgi:hypothetical protein